MLVVYQTFFHHNKKTEIVDREILNWESLELKGYRKGAINAPIQIVKFYHYECPYCKEIDPIVKKMFSEFSNEISIIYEHFPFDGESIAFKAAIVAECARKQGKFSEMHDLLFLNQNSLNAISFDSLAVEAEIENVSNFKECMSNQETFDIVQSGVNLGNELEIGGVPTFVINGKVVPGVVSENEFRELLLKILNN